MVGAKFELRLVVLPSQHPHKQDAQLALMSSEDLLSIRLMSLSKVLILSSFKNIGMNEHPNQVKDVFISAFFFAFGCCLERQQVVSRPFSVLKDRIRSVKHIGTVKNDVKKIK